MWGVDLFSAIAGFSRRLDLLHDYVAEDVAAQMSGITLAVPYQGNGRFVYDMGLTALLAVVASTRKLHTHG